MSPASGERLPLRSVVTVPMRHQRTYASDGVRLVLLVGSALHLVAIVVGVEGPAGVEIGAGPQDGLAVQLQGPHPVLLLYAMTQQLPVSARGPAGQPGGDGVRGVTGTLRSGGGAEEIRQAGGDFRMPVPPPCFPLFRFPSLPLSSQAGQAEGLLGPEKRRSPLHQRP